MVIELFQMLTPLYQYFSAAFTYAPAELILVLLLAVLIDLVFGEPPAAVHPVVWIGKLIGFLKAKAPKKHRKIYGTLMALTVICSTVLMAVLIVLAAHDSRMPYAGGIVIQAVFLKATFAIKCMVRPAEKIREKLDTDIEAAR